MAWGNKYYTKFTNETASTFEIFFAYDGWAGGITDLGKTTGNPLELSWINNDENILAGIVPLEAIVQILIPVGSTISFENFITTKDDEILVTVLKDGSQYIFHGWVVAEQGSQQFKDPPFVLEIKCTDGLGLLKKTPLTTAGGTNFTGRVKICDLLGGIFSKANPDLTFKTWCDIYEDSMTDRDTDPQQDMFFQTKLDHRSFLTSEVAYNNCYDVLTELIADHFTVFYYMGSWHVVRQADQQRTGPMQYVEYDINGSIVGSGTGDTATAKVGRTERTLTHGADAVKFLDFAKKRARVTYNYRIPENLVNNERITQLGDINLPLSGIGYRAYELVGWTQKHKFLHLQEVRSVQTCYIKTELDAFGYEQIRYYVIPVDLTATNAGNLLNYIINDNDDFFVDQYDKVSITFQYRYSTDLSDPNSTLSVGQLAIHREGTDPSIFSNWVTSDQNGVWNSGSGGAFFGVNLVGLNSTEWRTISFEDSILPATGRMYLTFGADDNLPAGTELHIKDINITYSPQIRGGYNPVKGDFNRYEQNVNYRNSNDDEVFISDSPKRIISGALFNSSGGTLLNPDWHRRGVAESKRYSALVAQGLYNLNYRKFRKIEGNFKGYDYEMNDGGPLAPIGPMTKFEFTDTGEARQYLCMNIRMNVKKCWFTGTMREIFDPALNDGNEEGDEYEFNYLF